MLFEIGFNSFFQRARAVMHTASKLLVGEFSEPAFDEIDPRRPGRSEVQVVAGPLGQPTLDGRSFVRGIVVKNDVNVQILGTTASISSRNLRNSSERCRR